LASAYGEKASPTNYNNTIALLRHVFAIACEACILSIDGSAISLPRMAARFNTAAGLL
jgi:hypothetical protein